MRNRIRDEHARTRSEPVNRGLAAVLLRIAKEAPAALPKTLRAAAEKELER
jgi:hypothetical protein